MGWSILVYVAGGVGIAVVAKKIQATIGGTEGLLDTWVDRIVSPGIASKRE